MNTDKLCYIIADVLDKTPDFTLEDKEEEIFEYTFKEEEKAFEIEIDNKGVYNVIGEPLRRIFEMADFNSESGVRRFARQLRFLGVDDALREKGIKDGDTVNVFGYEFEFYE